MKQRRYTDEQIAFALRQAEAGTRDEICSPNSASPNRPSTADEVRRPDPGSRRAFLEARNFS